MVVSSNYEVVDIAGEVLAVPVGEHSKTNRDVFTFTNAAAFLLKQMKSPLTFDDMVTNLTEEFDVEADTAEKDALRFVKELQSLGIIED